MHDGADRRLRRERKAISGLGKRSVGDVIKSFMVKKS
jgi:hypothetical protein